MYSFGLSMEEVERNEKLLPKKNRYLKGLYESIHSEYQLNSVVLPDYFHMELDLYNPTVEVLRKSDCDFAHGLVVVHVWRAKNGEEINVLEKFPIERKKIYRYREVPMKWW